MSILTLWKVDIFSISKEIFDSILILGKLWLILPVIPKFLPVRYLILSQILLHQLSNNTKYLILLWVLINLSILSYVIRNGFAAVEALYEMP